MLSEAAWSSPVRRVRGGSVAAVALLLLPTVPLLPGRALAQESRVNALLREAEALGVRTGLVAFSAAGDRVLAHHRAHEGFIPASNQKVLTSIAALHGLGPEFVFETGFALEQGVLVVRGGADPNWITGTEHDPARIFTAVARRLRNQGVTAVRAVELQAGVFGGPRRPEGWPQDQLDRPYCPPTGALVLDAGCFRARVQPIGGGASVDVLAPTVLPGASKVRIRPGQTAPWMRERDGVIEAHGRMPRGADPVVIEATVQDPARVFERGLEEILRREGVAVRADAPERDLVMPSYRSPLAPALRAALVESSNFHAEQVLRALGAAVAEDGSFSGGAAAMRVQLLALLGEVPETLRITDGSGLSRQNRVTPALLARAIAAARLRPDYGEALLTAMATPGEGTLKRRFADSPARGVTRAKSGWIRGASSLSGLVDGRAFAILMNYEPSRGGLNAKLKALQEHLVEAILAWGAR